MYMLSQDSEGLYYKINVCLLSQDTEEALRRELTFIAGSDTGISDPQHNIEVSSLG